MWFDIPELWNPDTTKDETSVCFNCSGELTTNETEGVMICTGCGTVNGSLIDKQTHQNTAIAEGSSINMYLPKSSLGTSIAGSAHMKIKIVNRWWKWEYKEKSFFDDKKEIEMRCYRANLTQAVVDNSLNLYKRVSEAKNANGKNAGKYVIIRGTNRRAIMAASVYYGAKLQRQPRSPKEIADVFDLEMNQMTKGCKRFLEIVDLTTLITTGTPKNESEDYVYSVCHRMNFDNSFRDKASTVMKNVQKLQLVTNHQPPAVAASVILLVVDLYGTYCIRKVKTDLSGFFKVSEVTITKTYKELTPWVRIITNTELADAYYEESVKSLGFTTKKNDS
jgi:transcription initiation factor TFIIB